MCEKRMRSCDDLILMRLMNERSLAYEYLCKHWWHCNRK